MKLVEKDISIVLPTWNRVKELKQTLPKLLSICNEKTEVIIIDNDSDDGTREYLMQVSETNHNIKLVFNNQNIGPNATIFIGLLEVNSPYVIIFCDDDYVNGNYVNECLEIFDNNHNVSVICSIPEQLQSLENTLNYHKNKNFKLYKRGSEAVKEAFVRSSVIPGTAWRMSELDLMQWPLGLGKDCIYPQVKTSIDLSLKGDLAVLSRSNTQKMEVEDLFYGLKTRPFRPNDYGVLERATYLIPLRANKIITSKEYFILLVFLASWIRPIIIELEKEDKEAAKRMQASLKDNKDLFGAFLYSSIRHNEGLKLTLMINILNPLYLLKVVRIIITKIY